MLILSSLQDIHLVEMLNNGGVAVIPTDTVYGLVAPASDQAAVKRLYMSKKREAKPGTVIASSTDQLVNLGIKRRYLKAVEHMWPGEISIVIPTGSDLKYIDQGKGSMAVRVVADTELIRLLDRTGPLLTTSANLPGNTPANTLAEAQKYFGDKVDVYVDGGDMTGKQPSTIIRIVDDAIEILRLGAVKINEKGEIES